MNSRNLASVASKSIIPLLALVALFAASIILVGVSGDFPLNDDWSYATSTRTLVTTGMWRPIGWGSMTLVSNALWAAPICAATHCAFSDLRVATLLAAVLLFSATYFLARLNSKDSILPLTAAALVAFNPIAYALSFTFMTDILFAALITSSAVLFILSLERDSVLLVVLGAAVALAATLSRQLGLCIPLAYLIVRLLQPGSWSRKLVLALFPILLCAGSLALFNAWLRATGRTPALYDLPMEQFSHDSAALFARNIVKNVSATLLYVGLFSLPILLLTKRAPLLARSGSRLGNVPLVAGAGAVILLISNMIYFHRIMPFTGNVLVREGIGPLTLRDTFILELPNVPALPPLFWLAVTLLGLWGAFLLVERAAGYLINTVLILRHRRLDNLEASTLFAAIAALAYYAPLWLTFMFDRYFIPPLPLIFFFVIGASEGARSVGSLRAAAAGALALAIAGFAVLATHDYLSWNRARWTAIADLQKTAGAGPANLDGGFEYNGLFSYDPSYRKKDGKSYWWIQNDDYQITFGPVDGMNTFKTYAYSTLLPPGSRSILVLHK